MSDEREPLWSDGRIADEIHRTRHEKHWPIEAAVAVMPQRIRDDYEASIAKLEAQLEDALHFADVLQQSNTIYKRDLAELEAQLAQTWTPLPDGRYELGTEDGTYIVIESDGANGYQRTEEVFPGLDEVSTFYWPDNIRLCRLATKEPPPFLTAAEFTEQLIDGMRDVLNKPQEPTND